MAFSKLHKQYFKLVNAVRFVTDSCRYDQGVLEGYTCYEKNARAHTTTIFYEKGGIILRQDLWLH